MDSVRRQPLRSSLIAAVVVLLIGYVFFIAAPSNFPTGKRVVVPRGGSVSEVADTLARAHVIRSSLALESALRLSGASGKVQAGTYLLDAKENVFTIAHRLATGAYHLPPVRITFPEGDTSRDIAEKVSAAFPAISQPEITSRAKAQEGYLFPDTYLFPPDATTQSVLETMRANFDAKIASLLSEVQTSGRSLSDIVTVASLLEKEARTDENRRIVAGVLWNRIARGMPLQVDAVFGYIYNRDTYSPSYDDLKIDSPYNTYTHKGLPPGPIGNPGLESIQAALHPTKTSYLFYLTDKNGVMHYATTYAAHQSNQEKYLR